MRCACFFLTLFIYGWGCPFISCLHVREHLSTAGVPSQTLIRLNLWGQQMHTSLAEETRIRQVYACLVECYSNKLCSEKGGTKQKYKPKSIERNCQKNSRALICIIRTRSNTSSFLHLTMLFLYCFLLAPKNFLFPSSSFFLSLSSLRRALCSRTTPATSRRPCSCARNRTLPTAGTNLFKHYRRHRSTLHIVSPNLQATS